MSSIMSIIQNRLNRKDGRRYHISHNDLDGIGCFLPGMITTINGKTFRYATGNLGNFMNELYTFLELTYWDQQYDKNTTDTIIISDIASLDCNVLYKYIEYQSMTNILIVDHHLVDEEKQKLNGLNKKEVYFNNLAFTVYYTNDCRLIYVHTTEASAAKIMFEIFDLAKTLQAGSYKKTAEFFELISNYDTGNFGNWRIDCGEISLQNKLNDSFYKYRKDPTVFSGIQLSAMRRDITILYRLWDSLVRSSPNSMELIGDEYYREITERYREFERRVLKNKNQFNLDFSDFLDREYHEVTFKSHDNLPMKFTRGKYTFGLIVTEKGENLPFSKFAQEFLRTHEEFNFLMQYNHTYETVELRSYGDRGDCHQLAVLNGGGGHYNAAGFKVMRRGDTKL